MSETSSFSYQAQKQGPHHKYGVDLVSLKGHLIKEREKIHYLSRHIHSLVVNNPRSAAAFVHRVQGAVGSLFSEGDGDSRRCFSLVFLSIKK